jgi:hypothetical protein
MRSLDRRLASILAGRYTPDDFIIADAKDPDMAKGVTAAGPPRDAQGRAGPGFKTRRAFLDDMAAVVKQGEVDILLASASNGERLAQEGLFARSAVTLAIRANDTTDIWLPRGGSYAEAPSHPFRSARLELTRGFCDLVLYSVTFNGRVDLDSAALEAYSRFRDEARRLGVRHFLEVFNPNATALPPEAVPGFVNDSIIRALAGVTSAERPLFLKVAYNGPAALEELAWHDPGLVVGLLGGGAGTTRDCFELLAQGVRHGARLALFGRKIQLAESPLDIVALLRPVIRGELSPLEAVRAYHAALGRKGIAPDRSFEADAVVTESALRAGERGAR